MSASSQRYLNGVIWERQMWLAVTSRRPARAGRAAVVLTQAVKEHDVLVVTGEICDLAWPTPLSVVGDARRLTGRQD
jgi:hypothetical protein